MYGNIAIHGIIAIYGNIDMYGSIAICSKLPICVCVYTHTSLSPPFFSPSRQTNGNPENLGNPTNVSTSNKSQNTYGICPSYHNTISCTRLSSFLPPPRLDKQKNKQI